MTLNSCKENKKNRRINIPSKNIVVENITLTNVNIKGCKNRIINRKLRTYCVLKLNNYRKTILNQLNLVTHYEKNSSFINCPFKPIFL